ncbi:MAG TPA: GlsB/YeaQ/YmgE family stress response membrane protein [Longimicrobiales bacterium]|nr:GlsB/YeaQ/YmgE family stress response membrane protein [Longimicrobiales bacterium]
MGILSWLVFGLIAGGLAKLIMPGKDPGGCLVTILIGIVGAVIGGFIGTTLGYGGITGFNLGSMLLAVVGAIILLLIYRLVVRRR